MPSHLAGAAIAAAGGANRVHHGALAAALRAPDGESFRIAVVKLSVWGIFRRRFTADSSPISPREASCMRLLNLAGWVKLAASVGSNEFAARDFYTEKEQSADSTATDVERDFNGRARNFCGCDGCRAPTHSWRV